MAKLLEWKSYDTYMLIMKMSVEVSYQVGDAFYNNI